jgi:hypothetical protein|tara:strand:+ start:930 stop:1274 length:345 start_codon:yes stop_codon:yes gene_type:complete
MSSNIITAMVTAGNGPLLNVATGATIGKNSGDQAQVQTTRILAVHAHNVTVAGFIDIKGEKQITGKTAKGTAIRFRMGVSSDADLYMGEPGVPVYGKVSVSCPSDLTSITVFIA